MPEMRVDTEALEAARVAVAGAVGPTRAAGEGMELCSPVAFGALGSGPAMIGAIANAVKHLDGDLQTAARHLEGADRALQGAVDAARSTDAAGAGALGAPAPGSGPTPAPGR